MVVCPELVTDGRFLSSTSAGRILHSISRHHPHKEIPEASWTSLYAVLCFHLAVLRFVLCLLSSKETFITSAMCILRPLI